MELKKVLDSRIVDLHMKAKTKDEALNHLTGLLEKAGYVSDCQQFVSDIYLREKEGLTGIGNYIAIPHGKSDSVSNVGIAIGKLDKEIEWETLDGNGVKIIFLFAVSNNLEYAQNHMGLLAQIAGKLGNDKAIAALQKVKTFDELLAVFQ
ncbi:MAG: fructose PTS transporter subunit IIA [Erysipelotrichaceae bacterium]